MNESATSWYRKLWYGMVGGMYGRQQQQLRAVKEIYKIAPGLQPLDYSHELEAIAKFSCQKVRHRVPIILLFGFY